MNFVSKFKINNCERCPCRGLARVQRIRGLPYTLAQPCKIQPCFQFCKMFREHDDNWKAVHGDNLVCARRWVGILQFCSSDDYVRRRIRVCRLVPRDGKMVWAHILLVSRQIHGDKWADILLVCS